MQFPIERDRETNPYWRSDFVMVVTLVDALTVNDISVNNLSRSAAQTYQIRDQNLCDQRFKDPRPNSLSVVDHVENLCILPLCRREQSGPLQLRVVSSVVRDQIVPSRIECLGKKAFLTFHHPRWPKSQSHGSATMRGRETD